MLCRWLAGTDRDGKVRVSGIPDDVVNGFSEIGSYCLGHAGCVTSADFMRCGDRTILVSCGVEGRLIAWDPISGIALGSLQVTELEHTAEEPSAGGAEDQSEVPEGGGTTGGADTVEAAAVTVPAGHQNGDAAMADGPALDTDAAASDEAAPVSGGACGDGAQRFLLFRFKCTRYGILQSQTRLLP